MDANKSFKFFFTNLISPTQVFYTGKSQALGIKQGGPSAGKWAELPITKSPKIVQLSVGHEGQHALLVAEDGSVFFVGLDRRGEGGDPNQCEYQFEDSKTKCCISYKR